MCNTSLPSNNFTSAIFLGSSNLILFGIIGEYLGRIFNASKNRPLYLVNEYNGQREENE